MQSNTERWLFIREFEGRYEVSNCGRIRSFLTGRILIQQVSNSGYQSVQLWMRNKGYGRFVHRLVAEEFLAHFKPDLQVNHLDGNKANNHLGNIELVTGSENMRHAVRELGFRPPAPRFGSQNHNARPVEKLDVDGRFLTRYESAADAVREGFRASCITECCNGTQKTHRGFRWRHGTSGGRVWGIA